jgi:HPt (histidine-containing phosphotransfer) domain-containing protein
MGVQAMKARSGADDRTSEAPSGSVPLVCEKTFAGFCDSSNDFNEAVLLRLVEGDMRLLRIASARARRDWAAVAQEANALAQTAAALGLFQASGLARQLEGACLSGNHAVTYRLIGRLSEMFQLSGTVLEALLRRGTTPTP